MTTALPGLAETVTSAATTGVELAGTLVSDVSNAMGTFADQTVRTARRWFHRRSVSLPARRSGTPVVKLVVVGIGTAALVAALLRKRANYGRAASAKSSGTGFDGRSDWVSTDDGAPPAPLHEPSHDERTGSMESKKDEIKGRVKEAAGALTGDDDLKRDGKLDQTGAAAKRKADQVRDKFDDVVDAVKDRVDRN